MKQTLLDLAKAGYEHPLFKKISYKEDIEISELLKLICEGKVVIPCNILRRQELLKKSVAIGKNLSIKVNVNLGISYDASDIETELKKLDIALKFGTDAVMDLSVSDTNISDIRTQLIANSDVPFGTVPIYALVCRVLKEGGRIEDIKEEEFLDEIQRQAQEGIDFMTVHSGIRHNMLNILARKSRVLPVVSRGGGIIVKWMQKTGLENPLFHRFNDVLDIARNYDITLSLGDGMRPGSTFDATDQLQIQELKELATLADRALDANVQSMIEGPGHVPLSQIEHNIKLEKELTNDKPFYILGPLVTDIAVGYDHIAGAIGSAWAAFWGADFLCYITPSEHLSIPDIDDVKKGLLASKICAHAADLAKGKKAALNKEREFAYVRATRNWNKQRELCMDKDLFDKKRSKVSLRDDTTCSMCSDICPIKLLDES